MLQPSRLLLAVCCWGEAGAFEYSRRAPGVSSPAAARRASPTPLATLAEPTRALDDAAPLLAEAALAECGAAAVPSLGADVTASPDQPLAPRRGLFGILGRLRRSGSRRRTASPAGGRRSADVSIQMSSGAFGGGSVPPEVALLEALSAAIRKVPGLLLAKRSAEIWAFVGDMATKMALAQRSGSSERKVQVSEELCEGLLRLGPTFIKLGQILSTRYDILPYDYVKGLEKLQDRVPAFDGELAYRMVVEDLGEDAFRDFDRTPIAAASLGQVHVATTAAGERVAVKVQRPGLKELFDADLRNLRILAELLRRLDNTPDSMLRDWREIFQSNADIIYEEIEYKREAANAERFAANFKGVPWVKVPTPYPSLTSDRVLTMVLIQLGA